MRRLLVVIAFLSVLLIMGINAFADDNSKVFFDNNTIKTGYIRIGYTSDSGKSLKVLVEKDGTRYIYNLRNDGIPENFPLQMGNGQYTVSVLQNIEGTTYNFLYKQDIDVNLPDSKIVYLDSVQNVNWNDTMRAIKKAKEITKGLKNDNDKIAAIYNYVVSNLRYDFVKYKNVQSGYIPDIDKTIQEKKGICYDYSSLFASMLRSSNIPTRLVMGKSVNVKEYHAWNQVYISNTGKWITIDTTYDSQMKVGKVRYSMIKPDSQYTVVKTY